MRKTKERREVSVFCVRCGRGYKVDLSYHLNPNAYTHYHTVCSKVDCCSVVSGTTFILSRGTGFDHTDSVLQMSWRGVIIIKKMFF